MLSPVRPRTIPPVVRNFINLYSTVSSLSRTKWHTSDKAPQSLVRRPEEVGYASPPAPKGHDRPSKWSHLSGKRVPQQYASHRAALREAFPQGWSPPRKLSREAMEGLRSMHASDPQTFTTPVLAQRFRISPEAVRRILKSKWEPSSEQRARLLERERRGREEWIMKRRAEENEKFQELQKLLEPEREVGRRLVSRYRLSLKSYPRQRLRAGTWNMNAQ